MTSPEGTLDLTSIGRELDIARQSRSRSGVANVDLETVCESESESDSSDNASSTWSPPISAPPLPEVQHEQPLPTCLLCFTRPPSAVLLPCEPCSLMSQGVIDVSTGCHLNLCYLCAPLLILKQQRPISPPPMATVITPSQSTDRIPFNVALKRASANHPKSRRLSSGGYAAPTIGERGSELKGEDMEAACDATGARCGLEGERQADGRLELSSGDEGDGAKCLICRAGVSGWLRVYT
jgi:hypothetical protein